MDARILEYPSAASDEDRNVFYRYLEAVKQGLHAGIAVDVDADVGITVAGEKLAHLERVGGMARPKQHRVAVSRCQKSHTAQDEGAHEDLAQLGVGLDDVAEIFFVDHENRAAFTHADAHEAGDTAQRAHLSGEIARQQHGDQLFAEHAGKSSLETAGKHNQQLSMTLAGLDQHLSGVRIGARTMRFQARDLRWREFGEYLLAAPFKKIARHCGLLHSWHRLSDTMAGESGSDSGKSSQLHGQLIDIAPAPVFSRLEGAHDGMLGRVEVLGRMLVLGRVATADVPASSTQTQVHPRVSHRKAFFTPAAIRLVGLYEA